MKVKVISQNRELIEIQPVALVRLIVWWKVRRWSLIHFQGFNHKQATTWSQGFFIHLQLSIKWESGCLYFVHDGMELIIAEIRQTSAGTYSHWASLSLKH